MVCEITGSQPGPRYVLDACLDTAPFGDEAAWTHQPVSGEIDEAGCMAAARRFQGRGGGLRARRRPPPADQRQLAGSLVLLFDVDEHTGDFGGARRRDS